MKFFSFTWKEKAVYAASMLLSKAVNANKNVSTYSPKRILCIKLDEIGDLCYSLHVFDLLKQNHPEAEITLLCKPFALSLVEHHPGIDVATHSWNDLTGYYDTIIDLRGNWRSIRYAAAQRPKVRLDRGTVRFTNMRAGKHPHEVFTNLQIITPLLKHIPANPQPEIYVGQQNIEKVKHYLQTHQLNNITIFHTGARKELRKWPADNFAKLAVYLKEKHGLDIVFTGDQSDIKSIEKIQQHIPFKTYNTAGLFNLIEFSALAKLSTLYVGNESGPLCIAAVSGATALGLFGPGEPFVFYPFGKNTAYIHHVLECTPCNQITCVHPTNPCIQRISVLEAQLACTNLLAKA